MIITSVLPCLSSDLAKNNKIISMFVLFPAFLAILKFSLLWKIRDKVYTKAV